MVLSSVLLSITLSDFPVLSIDKFEHEASDKATTGSNKAIIFFINNSPFAIYY